MCCSQHHGRAAICVREGAKWHWHFLCGHPNVVQSSPAKSNAAHVDVKAAQGIERANGWRDDVNFPSTAGSLFCGLEMRRCAMSDAVVHFVVNDVSLLGWIKAPVWLDTASKLLNRVFDVAELVFEREHDVKITRVP